MAGVRAKGRGSGLRESDGVTSEPSLPRRTRSQTSQDASQASEIHSSASATRAAARKLASAVAPAAIVAAAGSDAIYAEDDSPSAAAGTAASGSKRASQKASRKARRAAIVAAAPSNEGPPVAAVPVVAFPANPPDDNITLACPHGDCKTRCGNASKMRKHHNSKHASARMAIPDLSYVNSKGLTQCRHCYALYALVHGSVASHRSCKEMLAKDKRDAADPAKAAKRIQVAKARGMLRTLAGRAPVLNAKDAAAAQRAVEGWKPHQKHSLPVWFAVIRAILAKFVEALEKGPDGVEAAETAIVMFLLTAPIVSEWNEGDGFQEVGDGTGVDVPSDDLYAAPQAQDAAKAAEKQYAKVGSLFAEGLPRRALKTLLRKPLLTVTAARHAQIKELLGMEPRERPIRGAADGGGGVQAAAVGGAAAAAEEQGDSEDDGESEEPPPLIPVRAASQASDGGGGARAALPVERGPIAQGDAAEGGGAGGDGGEQAAVAPGLGAAGAAGAAAVMEGDAGHSAPISQDTVRAYCCNPDRLESSRDIYGWHIRDFKMLINSQHVPTRSAFVKMTQYFAQCKARSPKLLELIRQGLLHPIDKKGDGKDVRPAVSGVHLIQMAESIMVRVEATRKAISADIGDFNVSNGSPQEALPAAVQIALAACAAPDAVVVKGDIKNAHSSIDREVIFELASACPALEPLIVNRYGGTNRVVCINSERKLKYIVESKRGVLQGDPLATAAFTRAYCEVLNQVRRRFGDVVILGIADDTYFIGALDRVLEAWALALRLAEEQLGLTFRPDKSAAFARDATQISQAQREALAVAQIPLVDGIEVVGVPLGTAAYVQQTLDDAVAGIRAKADALVQTHKSSPNTGQALFTAACLGLASMFTHLMRSLPPVTVEAHARQVDTIAVQCVTSLLALGHVDLESEEGRQYRERLFLPAAEANGGMGLMSCARTVDAAYLGHWGLVGPAVQKMLPRVDLTGQAAMDLPPLAALKRAAEKMAAASEEPGIKLLLGNVPQLLSNSTRGLQGKFATHLSELASKRFRESMPTGEGEPNARKRGFISGASKEAGAGIHVSRRSLQCRLTDDEHRVTCALRLGVDAFPPPLAAVKCPDCGQTLGDWTAHALACSSIEAQSERTTLHTANDVVVRALLRDLNPELVVTGSNDAYPADLGMRHNDLIPEALNHRADARVYDARSGTTYLIDFTFTNSARLSGKNGAAPGGHADEAEAAKYAQYNREFPGFGADSSPALVVLSGERHGSISKGSRDYWDAVVKDAHGRQATQEFPVPLSVMIRRVRQTLAVAMRRLNASRILQFRRRALEGAQRVRIAGQGVEGLAGV